MTQLSLVDFRNYESVDVDLHPGPNLFVGRNGQGKTNLVEALGFLSTLGSHRVSSDHAMIRRDQDSAIVRARVTSGERHVLVEAQLNRRAPNRAQLNRSAIPVRELPRHFASVLFAPEDLALVKGEPGGRRRFLDQLLVLRNPRLAAVLADYDRVLKQRNTLLKSARAGGLRGDGLSTLDVWDDRLLALGSAIIDARHRLVGQLAPPVSAAYTAIAGDEQLVALRMVSSVDPAEPIQPEEGVEQTEQTVQSRFRAALELARRAELDRAVTLVGPHRDDLGIELNGMEARGYASHGESWSLALALKLASAELLRRDSSNGDPVVILDDVFAELDRSRRARLATEVMGFEQVLITAAVLEDVPAELARHPVHIADGRILRG